jgi:DNA-binding CsgD family transcriptional regulator
VTELNETLAKILTLISHGYTNREIGKELSLTEHTIKSHVRALFDELQAVDRAHAVRIGFEQGLLCTASVRRSRPRNPATRVMRQRQRELVDGRLVAVNAPAHGRYTTYSNWACRCLPCTDAARVQAAKYKRAPLARRVS